MSLQDKVMRRIFFYFKIGANVDISEPHQRPNDCPTMGCALPAAGRGRSHVPTGFVQFCSDAYLTDHLQDFTASALDQNFGPRRTVRTALWDSNTADIQCVSSDRTTLFPSRRGKKVDVLLLTQLEAYLLLFLEQVSVFLT